MAWRFGPQSIGPNSEFETVMRVPAALAESAPASRLTAKTAARRSAVTAFEPSMGSLRFGDTHGGGPDQAAPGVSWLAGGEPGEVAEVGDAGHLGEPAVVGDAMAVTSPAAGLTAYR